MVTLRQRIKNLTECIADGEELGFSKFYMARLRTQLKQLKEESKEDNQAGKRILSVLHSK